MFNPAATHTLAGLAGCRYEEGMGTPTHSISPPPSLRHVWRQDWPCYASLLAYIAFSAALVIGTGREFEPARYSVEYLTTLSTLLLVWLMMVACLRAIKRNPAHPLYEIPAAARSLLTPQLLVGLASLVIVPVFMNSFLAVKKMMPLWQGYVWDVRLADIDQRLHGGHDPWNLLIPWLSSKPVVFIIQICYESVWFLAASFSPVILAVSDIPGHIKRCFFYTYVLSWVVLGNVLAAIYMSAGPAFYGVFTSDTTRFAAIRPFLEQHNYGYQSAADLQGLLLAARAHGNDIGVGDISAFPSMHLSMAVLIVLLLTALSRRWLWPGVFFILVIQIGSVLLGWHYAIDGYVSIIGTILIWQGVSWAQKLSARRAAS